MSLPGLNKRLATLAKSLEDHEDGMSRDIGDIRDNSTALEDQISTPWLVIT